MQIIFYLELMFCQRAVDELRAPDEIGATRVRPSCVVFLRVARVHFY